MKLRGVTNFAFMSCSSKDFLCFSDLPFQLHQRKLLRDLVLSCLNHSHAYGSCTDWSRLKVSLLISFGGLGVHRVSLFASTTFIGWLDQSKKLVSDFLDYIPPTSVHLTPTLSLEYLVLASGKDDWSSLERVDVPLRQCAPSIQGCWPSLHQSSCEQCCYNIRAKVLALSSRSAIPHAGDWPHAVP